MVKLCPKEDVGMIGGVPTWTMVLLRSILDATGKNNILDVWPNLSVYFHGGVGFGPYKNMFDSIMPMDAVFYLEAYNASEGFFGIQDQTDSDEMLLMLITARETSHFVLEEAGWEVADLGGAGSLGWHGNAIVWRPDAARLVDKGYSPRM